MIENKTEEEITQLVRDTVAGKIFWASMIDDADWPHLVKSIFMPLAFMEKPSEEELEQMADFYEYLSEAGPRAINGYPCFFSVRVINRHDKAIFRVKFAAAEAALDDALKPTPQEKPND